MIMLDRSAGFELLVAWTDQVQHPVSKDPFTQNFMEGCQLSFVDGDEAFPSRFANGLRMRKLDVSQAANHGFLFLKTTNETSGELDYLRSTDLSEFLE